MNAYKNSFHRIAIIVFCFVSLVVLLVLLKTNFVSVASQDNTHINGNTDNGVYQVWTDDTIASIASMFGVTVDSLLLANHLPKDAVIQAGQTITIPPRTFSQ